MMAVLQQGIATAVQLAITETMTRMPVPVAPSDVPVPDARAGKRMDERHFRRMKTFDGTKETDWKEWGFQFRVAVRASSRDVSKVMDWIESQTEEVDRESIVDEFQDGDYVDRMSSDLYDVLCMLLGGEPLMTIQGIKDMNGFRAWQRLVMKYHPVTPARALMCMIEAVTPPKAKTLRELPAHMEKWELRVFQLERDFGEKMSENEGGGLDVHVPAGHPGYRVPERRAREGLQGGPRQGEELDCQPLGQCQRPDADGHRPDGARGLG
jgi:hypothetical protein